MGLFDFNTSGDRLNCYKGNAEKVVIPKRITCFGERAFVQNKTIKILSAPNGISYIANYCFTNAEKLEAVDIPSGLKTIGINAFWGCRNLRKFKFPDGFKKIDREAFCSCTGLEEVVFPDSLELIGSDAFKDCTNLRKVVIPEKAKISYGAFLNCNNITEIKAGSEYLTDKERFINVFGEGNLDLFRRINGISADRAACEDISLSYRTRADLPVNGKKHIFIHYAPQDRSDAWKLMNSILDYENGIDYALWYTDNPQTVFFEKNFEPLRQMAVFIPFVTDNYLNMARGCGLDASGLCRFSLQDFNLNVTTVLPVFAKKGLGSRFTGLFGPVHGINISAGMLEKHLKRLLGDDELSKTIEDNAFSKDLFLSYRKKDRDNAIAIMKNIHDTEEGRRIAIWFDDFLIPGEDYREQINDYLKGSDAVILSVTPNILEEGNYVRRVEYPDAKDKLSKKILPVEAVLTDPAELKIAFPGLDTLISISDLNALNDNLKSIQSGRKNRDYSPYDTYLLGMAFLIGLHVEKDIRRGVAFLEEAASGSEVNALVYLGFLYLTGRGVHRDLNKTSDYYMKAYEIYKSERKVKELYDLLYGMDGLILILGAIGKNNEALRIGKEFEQLFESVPAQDEKEAEERKLWKARLLDERSDVYFEKKPSKARLNEAEAGAREMIDILSGYSGEDKDEAAALLGCANANLGKIYLHKGKLSEAQDAFEKAKDTLAKVVKESPAQEYRKIFAGILIDLGLLLREDAIQKSMSDPMHSIELMQPARNCFSRAEAIERNLVSEEPTINNREGLAIALFNYALTLPEKKDAAENMQEAYDIVRELQEETKDGSFDDFERDIKNVCKKRWIKLR